MNGLDENVVYWLMDISSENFKEEIQVFYFSMQVCETIRTGTDFPGTCQLAKIRVVQSNRLTF